MAELTDPDVGQTDGHPCRGCVERQDLNLRPAGKPEPEETQLPALEALVEKAGQETAVQAIERDMGETDDETLLELGDPLEGVLEL